MRPQRRRLAERASHEGPVRAHPRGSTPARLLIAAGCAYPTARVVSSMLRAAGLRAQRQRRR